MGQGTAGPASFRRGVFFSSGGTIAVIGCLFLETVIATRLLEPSDFGLFLMLVVVCNLFVMLVDFGGRNGLTQLIATADAARQRELASNALSFRVLVVGGVSALIWLAQALLLWLDPDTLLWQYLGFVPLMFMATSVEELLFGVLRGLQSYRQIATADLLRSASRLLLSGLLLLGPGLGVLALIASWSASYLLSICYQLVVLPVALRPQLRRAVLSEILCFGLPLQLTRLLVYASGQVQLLVLTSLTGPASVAFYGVAARVPDALQRLSEAYINVYFPAVAAQFGLGKRERAIAMLERSARVLSFLGTSAALTALLFGHEIVTLLFSAQYAASAPTFAVLMAALHGMVLVALMGYTLTAAGYPGRALVENVTRTTLVLVGGVALIPWFDYQGAAYATLLAAYVGNLVSGWLLWRSGVRADFSPHLKQTLLFLGCGGLFWLFQPESWLLRGTLLLLFGALSVLLATIRREDIDLVLPSLNRRGKRAAVAAGKE